MTDDEVRAMVAEMLAEQHRLQQANFDAIVLRTVALVLASFGIEDDDRKELRADFQHLRRWRTSVEQAQSYTLKAVITVIATGLMGVIGLSVKDVLGKRASATTTLLHPLTSSFANGPSHVQNSHRGCIR